MFEQSLITLFVLLLSVAVQSVVGFGLGMIAIPLLLWQGLPLNHCVFLGLSLSLFSSLVAGQKMGSQLPWRQSAIASGYRLIGILPGLLLGGATASHSPTTLKGVIGVIIGLGVAAQAAKMLGRAKMVAEGTPPSAKLAPWAFLCSGVLTGWLGMGGPPLVFWQLTGRTSAQETRGFLFGVYVLSIPFQLALMFWADPNGVTSLFPILLVSLPLTLLVSKAALAIGDRISVIRLQWFSLAFLALLAARSLADWGWSVL